MSDELLAELRTYWTQQKKHAFRGSVRYLEAQRVLQLIAALTH